MQSFAQRANAVALEGVPINGKEEPKLTEWEQKKIDALTGTNGDPALIHDALYGLLMDEASKVIKSNRPIRQQRSLIKAIAYALEFKFSNADVAELYDSLDASVAAYESDVEPDGEFLALSQSWMLHELILIGLNLFVGMPGAGKSRFLIALVRAFLNDQSTFIGRSLLPGAERHVQRSGRARAQHVHLELRDVEHLHPIPWLHVDQLVPPLLPLASRTNPRAPG